MKQVRWMTTSPSIVFLLLSFVTNKGNAGPFEQLQEIQESFKAELTKFERTTVFEITKLKEKIEILEAKVEELSIALQDCNAACSKDKGTTFTFQERTRTASDLVRRPVNPKTCLEARENDPTLKSGMYWIDPDGQQGDSAIYVYCNMTSGSTSVLHDSVNAIEVDHCLNPGCYSRNINYNATLRQMTMLAELSNECHQSIQIECFDSIFEFNGIPYAWWNDRKGEPRYFWSGSYKNTSTHYHICQCGLDNSCQDPHLSCNCDSNLAIPLSDKGVITEHDMLPVTKLNFGRTIAPTSISLYTLGPLECSGKVVLNGMPASCHDLWRLGYTLSGLYSVKGVSSKRVETVYCDFTKLPGDEGLQTWIGLEEVRSKIVFFDVVRSSPFSGGETVLSFNEENLNVGRAFNLTSGVFTVPTSGIYYFSFTSTASETGVPFVFELENDGVEIAACRGSYNDNKCYMTTAAKLVTGEKIGVLYKSGNVETAEFLGWLVAQDVFDSGFDVVEWITEL